MIQENVKIKNKTTEVIYTADILHWTGNAQSLLDLATLGFEYKYTWLPNRGIIKLEESVKDFFPEMIYPEDYVLKIKRKDLDPYFLVYSQEAFNLLYEII